MTASVLGRNPKRSPHLARNQTIPAPHLKVRMNRPIELLFVIMFQSIQGAAANEVRDPLCKPLLTFIASVNSGEVREFTLHTIWGRNFNDATAPVMYSKRCEHGGDGPSKEVCRYFVNDSAVEFAALNAKRALSCLSPDTRIGRDATMDSAAFSFSIVSARGGTHVTVEFGADQKLGGMALRVVAKGD